jgi:hypothetical protein
VLGIGLAESIPEIIVANLWNLARKYAPGLKFLTSAGETRQGLTRRRQHNAHQEFMRQSPIYQNMWIIQHNLHRSLDVPEHQNFFNIEHLRSDESGGVRTLHLEFRFPDGDLCPTSITAKAFLFLTMLLKAVEISKFGLVHVGRVRQWRRKKALLDRFSNNDGPLATSDTSELTGEELDECRLSAGQLLKDLKSIFLLLDTPAENVLYSLADRPISLRRAAGVTWTEMENEFQSVIAPSRTLDELDLKIIKIVELGLLENAPDEDGWFKSAAVMSGIPGRVFRERLFGLKNRAPVWSRDLGRMVFTR